MGYLISEFTWTKMKQNQLQSEWGLPVTLGYFYPPRAILAFKHWALQQVTVPSNFKKIIQVTNEGKDDGKTGEVKVICVGLSRTGTSSLKAALSILLPGLTYHGMDPQSVLSPTPPTDRPLLLTLSAPSSTPPPLLWLTLPLLLLLAPLSTLPPSSPTPLLLPTSLVK